MSVEEEEFEEEEKVGCCQVEFCSISTLFGNLKPNPVNIYIYQIHMIC